MNTATATDRPFDAEVGRLLDLVVHSLYSEREIFLRELVANAADATDRRRFLALSDESLALPEGAAIRISIDKPARTITIADDGIGMTAEDLASHLGTIARSGTRAFTASLAEAKPEDRPNLIGQFGVGFYSAFMVADRVEVTSRRAGTDAAHKWSSEGTGGYRIEAATRETPGTDIVLHVKSDADEFLEPVRLETILRKWADHISVPVEIERDGKFQKANEGTALWRRRKADIAEKDYTDFYRHLGHMFDEPWATIHWSAEGTVEFSALLFIPGRSPFPVTEDDRESHVRLHVKRMFITDDAKLLPTWLRFVEGVVDTEDLPLNVSREMLQSTPVLARIRKALVNRVLGELKTRAKEAETYRGFIEQHGPMLKEGIYDDADHRNEIAALARFRSTHGEELTSLDDYVTRMQEGQKDIYYITGEDPARLAASPQIEGLRAKGYEVLLLSDQIDFFWPERLGTYEGHKLVHAGQARDMFDVAETPEPLKALIDALKSALGEQVGEVRASTRLTDSPAALAAGEAQPDLALQRLLRRAGRPSFAPPPALELNPAHRLIEGLVSRAAAGEAMDDWAALLLDLARIQDGESPVDPARFARLVADRMAGNPA
ncbi:MULTISPECIES: molecular chaperone HtpG [Acidiphilium]|uniref:molecular chaperone HtpG n=1 Tax=Acidiphilium TaxID=522 RepID=UPI001B8D44CE|nr:MULTISPECIES: molecular chaperone HtpG [Acidiphilium]MBS3023398.1 molecular chaperone HtpG [Acidiphilium multivorum]MBU6355224.1 molecular chaperone HtpG [Rhodospirillales bacterium]MDE2328369.1 molecular chaperone HtpG [Rhodospirillales bacterium]UNC14690.1 molecular chaperone HtpG [Acidiphilium multivorum]